LPSWNHNLDRIFVTFGKRQKEKQLNIKKVYKTLDDIQGNLAKEETRYKNEVKKCEKEL
jgi:hypothetical protein